MHFHILSHTSLLNPLKHLAIHSFWVSVQDEFAGKFLAASVVGWQDCFLVDSGLQGAAWAKVSNVKVIATPTQKPETTLRTEPMCSTLDCTFVIREVYGAKYMSAPVNLWTPSKFEKSFGLETSKRICRSRVAW